MKTKLQSLFLVLALLAGVHQAAAQSTAFTYQGRLNVGTNAATGLYDFQMCISDSATVGTYSYTNTYASVPVTNGLFMLQVDFAPLPVFQGSAQWLEIHVRTNATGSYTTLGKQPVTSVPYAMRATVANVAGFAGSVGIGSINNAALATGAVDYGNLTPTVASNTFWRLKGNANTTPGANFLGTTDNQPLYLDVNGSPMLVLDTAQNVMGGNGSSIAGANNGFIGGGSGNSITMGSYSAIGAGKQNSVTGGYVFIGGGSGNSSGAQYASICGGQNNNASTAAFVGGGSTNNASGQNAAITGGYQNIAGGIYSFIGGGMKNGTDSQLSHRIEG